VYSIGTLLGVPGARPVAEAALAGLLGPLKDDEHGGWYPSVAAGGMPADGKTAYTHAFVVLAGSSAAAAGLPELGQTEFVLTGGRAAVREPARSLAAAILDEGHRLQRTR
jgi:mannose/cellobiose epimerase-like protein (N-acyl-D-glucosamine 2-epimerase family)